MGYRLLSLNKISINICTKYLEDNSKKTKTSENKTGIDLIIFVGS